MAPTRSLDVELILLATPSARLTSSNKLRHAAAQHRSLHKPPRLPFFAYGTQDHKPCLCNCSISSAFKRLLAIRRRSVVSGGVSTPGIYTGGQPPNPCRPQVLSNFASKVTERPGRLMSPWLSHYGGAEVERSGMESPGHYTSSPRQKSCVKWM